MYDAIHVLVISNNNVRTLSLATKRILSHWHLQVQIQNYFG